MTHRIDKTQPTKMSRIEKIILWLIPIPLLFLFIGTRSMIDAAGPFEMNAISLTLNGFYSHFDKHIMILTGAFCMTLMLWFSTRKYWK